MNDSYSNMCVTFSTASRWHLIVYEYLPTSNDHLNKITSFRLTFFIKFQFWKNFITKTKVNMFETIYSLPFLVLEVPNLKIKQPTWFHQPSSMTIFSFVLLSYFLVTGGKWIISIQTKKYHVLAKYYYHFSNRHYLWCDRWTPVRWIDYWWTRSL